MKVRFCDHSQPTLCLKWVICVQWYDIKFHLKHFLTVIICLSISVLLSPYLSASYFGRLSTLAQQESLHSSSSVMHLK